MAGTRAGLLEELEKWAKMDADFIDYSIYILSGTAGTGKSTIAYEVARRLEEENLLGASFFFVRGAEKLSTTRFVLPTIAVQLAKSQPDIYQYIVEATRTYLRHGTRQQLEFQLKDLLVEPLKRLPREHSPLVIIIDAVDECTESAQDEVAHLLLLLMKNIRLLKPFPLRILLTTRPEIHIETALSSYEFHDITRPFKLQDIPRDAVNADISQYLEDGFIHFKFKDQLALKRPNAVAELTQRAEGLFIYASTARQFIFRNTEDPDEAAHRIERLVSETETVVHTVTGRLDKLYLTILDHALPESLLERPNFTTWTQDVLGSIAVLQDQVTPRTLGSLIDIPFNGILNIISRLASVILVPDNPDVEIRPIHASFPQFLVDRNRCTNPSFFIEPTSHHSRFALVCLTILNKPHILHEKIQDPIPPHVQYACAHWATHLASSQPTPALFALLRDFLATKLLLWFEVLGVMKRLGVAAPGLFRVRAWSQVSGAIDVG